MTDDLRCNHHLVPEKWIDPVDGEEYTISNYCSDRHIETTCKYSQLYRKPLCTCGHPALTGQRCDTFDYGHYLKSVSKIILENPAYGALFIVTVLLTIGVVAGMSFFIYKRRKNVEKKCSDNDTESKLLRSSCDIGGRNRACTVPINNNLNAPFIPDLNFLTPTSSFHSKTNLVSVNNSQLNLKNIEKIEKPVKIQLRRFNSCDK